MKYICTIVVFFFACLTIGSLIWVNRAMASINEEPMHPYKMHVDSFYTPIESLNRYVSEKLDEIKTSFLEEMKLATEQNNQIYTLNVTYDSYETEEYLSFVFYIETYTGGAHPNLEIWTVVWDKTNRLIVTNESFTKDFLEKVSEEVRGDLLMNPKITSPTWLFEGTRPIKENFKSFVYTNYGLLFFFSPYQVAPYSSGLFETLVFY